ncbi:MAG: tetratricopeptide repeat protein [Candidatus Korobacteraceae bacterium]
MLRRTIVIRLALYTVLACACAVSQEPYEDRAARLQPEEIPSLIQKAKSGDLSSQVLLWLAYSGGHGVPKDASNGLPYLRMAAEQGSIESEWVLSTLYEFGRAGVAVDHAEAFKWALKAAQGGHMVAQHNVATAYFHGQGVQQNLQQALIWYRRAAEQGFAHSEWKLGEIYLKGEGVAVNRDEALKWLTMALAQGHVPTMLALAEMYTNASGVPLQPQLVFNLYRAAAQRGDQYAEFQVGRFYREGYLSAPDYAQAMAWFKVAAADDYGPADQYLGAMYESGQGVPVDLAQARSHYERAARVGVSGAIQKMGEIYRDGRGVPADPVTAYMWFAIGARMGASDSQDALAAMKPHLTQAQRDMADARANTWAVEHPDAMEQTPGHFSYQSWTPVERGPQPSRSPSTPEERKYAILLTRHLEQDPLSLEATAARAWLSTWWDEIPDIVVRPCNLVDAPNHEPYEYGKELYQQVTYSEGAYILENPGKATDWNAAFLAGVKGALRAYQAILKQKPAAEYAFLDDLLQQQNNGRLDGTVSSLVKERCK